MLPRVAILASTSNRTRLYLQQMVRHNLIPSSVILLCKEGEASVEAKAAKRSGSPALAEELGFDLAASPEEILQQAGIPCTKIMTNDPNHPDVVEAIAGLSQDIVVYSGPGGAILRAPLLGTGKRFLHVHPGDVPDYRGSTTVYYSLINEGNLAASAIYLEAKIDAGPVLMRRTFEPPEDRTSIDLFYDPYVRSVLLMDVLEIFARGDEPELEQQNPEQGETYYIVHPVLKSLAILGRD